MKDKFVKISVAIVLLAIVIGGMFFYREMNQDRGSKKVEIVIKDIKNKTIFDERISTDAGTLANLLKEMEKKEIIKLEYKKETFGMLITGLGNKKIIKAQKGQAWIYNSKNNKVCKKAGYCDGADILPIADKDKFIFELIEY